MIQRSPFWILFSLDVKFPANPRGTDLHRRRQHVHDGSQRGEAHARPPPPIRVIKLARGILNNIVQPRTKGPKNLLLAVSLNLGLGRGLGLRRGRGVQRLRGQHLWRVVDLVQRLHGAAVELEQVQTRDVVEGIGDDFVGFEEFGLFVANVDGVVVGAGRGSQLAPVHADRCQHDAAVAGDRVRAVLPLHYRGWALWCRC